MDSNASLCDSEVCRRRLAEELNNDLSSVLLPVTAFVGVEAVLGFLGNALVIYIYLFRYHVCNFKYFVLFLAVIDLLSCLTTVPGEMITQLYWYVYPVEQLCKTKSFMNMFSVAGCATILTVMSVDRFLKICRPFGWQMRPRMALFFCGGAFVIGGISALPVPFLWGLRSYTKLYRDVNITVTLCEKDRRYEATQYPRVYSITMLAIFCCVMLVIIGFYVAVARTLIRKTTDRGRSSVADDSSLPNSKSATIDIALETSTTSNSAVPIVRTGSSDQPVIGVNIKPRTSSTGDDPDRHLATAASGVTMMAETAREPQTVHSRLGQRVRRKTLIMFLVTIVYVITTSLYLILLYGIAKSDDILDSLTDAQKTAYFFFFRLYFVNHVIDPVLYGLLDPECRRVLRSLWTSRKNGFHLGSH